ncbi:lysine 5,6-aminomutase subunit alpha TIM-barrel domain-containing protein [Rhodoferax sp.]|uniref:lysine 5,6-aminomutase subunit alpha n=1 Tax=Rhodoferax sp. TaxID=50421 RepID=UPI002752959E|nr:lysine 5,6-aminomutase subunit alpha [Rhodoferax sp.]
MTQLNLDQAQIDRARDSARRIARQVFDEMERFTTTTVERATLRLLGVDGVDENDIPLPNRVVSHLQEQGLLACGAATILAGAMHEHRLSAQQVAEAVSKGSLTLTRPQDEPAARQAAEAQARAMCAHIAAQRAHRDDQIRSVGEANTPWLYLIVATGNIHEDVVQARAAAEQGADIIAVIRSTGQSLLDYVPFGATTEGFGGTYATQENFRLMRAALDEVGAKVGRYIRLTNYCSGLCMPEIAAMGAMERLDMMLNDSMYGIIFRDINMKRTFIDQFFSRMVNAYAGIIINTGEDNYLTTADAFDAAHTVLASQLINEQFAELSGLKPEQMGLGHAFEIHPELENGFLWELAHAQLVRQVFPDAALKYMPPTKHMTGNIFKGQVQDTLFNIVSTLTQQNIHLLGMMTEAIHTPFIQDRFLAIQNAKYVFGTMKDLHSEIEFKRGGQIEQRAQAVLAETETMLAQIETMGLPSAIGKGMFAEISRTPTGGKGLDGVIEKADNYYNPFPDLMLPGFLGSEPKFTVPSAPPAGVALRAAAKLVSDPNNPPEKWVKPYGDTLGDGRVQLSFTLPVALDETSKEGAKRLAAMMGLDEPAVVHCEDTGQGFSFYVVYGQCKHQVDLSSFQVVKPEFEVMDKDAINALIAEKMGRRMVVVGACIETDAHTVGIDAIMNMKGFNGHKGLESYHEIRAINMGAQVDSEELVARAIEEKADVILVSQVVTQKNIHLDNLTKLSDLLEAEGLRDKVILVVGGPRISHELAKELGYDAGFGTKSYAEDVASFAIHEWINRKAA